MLSREIQALEDENKALKRTIEKITVELEEKGMKPMACEYCVFYIQHYAKTEHAGFIKTYCGHCVHGKRHKDRKPDNKSCEYFKLGTNL